MIVVREKCLRSLEQEPGGALCVTYRYRVEEQSIEELLTAKAGNAVIELISDHKLFMKHLAEILGIEEKRIRVLSEQYPQSSSDNPGVV